MDIQNTGLSIYSHANKKAPSKCDLLEQAFLENYLKTSKLLQGSESEFSFIFYEEISRQVSEKFDLNLGCNEREEGSKKYSR